MNINCPRVMRPVVAIGRARGEDAVELNLSLSGTDKARSSSLTGIDRMA